MNKFITASEAASHIKDGMTIMVGGFLANGSPLGIIAEIEKCGAKNLTVICNDTAYADRGVGRLVASGQVSKVIVSHIGTNPVTVDKMNSGEIIVEFSPQGTLAERIRSGGAGLGGVLTPTGLGTVVAQGKEVVTVDGHQYLLEKPLRADVAIISGSICDEQGNIVYKGTTQNFNPMMATAADLVIAEVEEVVPTGTIEMERVHTPHIFIDKIVKKQ